MKCPVDQTTLTIADRQGIEIDFCPTCRGVWLDRGELDKLIERAANFTPVRHEDNERRDERQYDDRREYERHRPYDDDDDHHDSRSHYERDGHHGKHRKKESFLGDLFDF